MKTYFFLNVNRRGSVSTTKNTPSLKADEISIKLCLELPDALFNRPKLQANITIPDEAAKPEIINSLVIDNVQEAIKAATGLDFTISIVNQPDEDVNNNRL